MQEYNRPSKRAKTDSAPATSNGLPLASVNSDLDDDEALQLAIAMSLSECSAAHSASVADAPNASQSVSSRTNVPSLQHGDHPWFDGNSLFMIQNPLIRTPAKRGYIELSAIVRRSADLSFAIATAMCVDPQFIRTLVGPQCSLIVVMDGGDDMEARSMGAVRVMNEKTTVCVPRMPLPKVGCMHAKLFILEYADRLRVAISSSNLDAVDYDWIGQCIWAVDVPKKKAAASAALAASGDAAPVNAMTLPAFARDLFFFLLRLNVPKATVERLFDSSLFDFSVIPPYVSLICSVPGFHSGTALHRYGHMALRDRLAPYVGRFVAYESQLVYQTSSVGLLDADFRRQFLSSVYHDSSESMQSTSSPGQTNVHVLYPSRTAALTTRSEGCQSYMCLLQKHWDHFQFPRAWFRDLEPPDADSEGLLWHSKILLRICRSSGCSWIYAGSHNFSPSAWGRLRQTAKTGQCLQVFNFELGVLFLPESTQSRVLMENGPVVSSLLPFAVPHVALQSSTRPLSFQPFIMESELQSDDGSA